MQVTQIFNILQSGCAGNSGPGSPLFIRHGQIGQEGKIFSSAQTSVPRHTRHISRQDEAAPHLPCCKTSNRPFTAMHTGREQPGSKAWSLQWKRTVEAVRGCPASRHNLRTGCGCRILDLRRKQHRTTKSFGPSDRRGLSITERAITEALNPGGRGGAVKGKGGAVKGKGVAVKGRGGGPHAASTLAPQRRPHSLQSTVRRHRRLVLLWNFHAPCRHGAGGVRHAVPCRVWRIRFCQGIPPQPCLL